MAKMKSLDEVVKALENCNGSDAECCDKCSYKTVNAEGVTICAKCELEDDALHYLREYLWIARRVVDQVHKKAMDKFINGKKKK